MAASPNDPRHFLYPLNRTSEYVLVDDEGNVFDTSPEGLKASIDYDATSKWGLASCYLQIEDRDFVWAYFAKPDGIILAVGRCSGEPFWEADFEKHALHIQWDRRLTERLMKNPIAYEEFQQRVQVGATPANEATARLLDQWLDGKRSARARADDREVQIIKRMVRTRQGQQGFRDDLIRTYGGRCFVTGCTELAALEAAHIRAVRKKGRHSVRNGMLLRADIHNLFDRGLFVIDKEYVVTLHPRIKKDPCYQDLDGKDLRAAAQGGTLPGLKALRFHERTHFWD
jgi:predicted restriction endonuclease